MRMLAISIAIALTSCGIVRAQDPPVPPSGPYCARNPFNRDAAEPLPIGLTDWHGAECRDCEFYRAGCPQTLRRHATGPNPNYWGWWVGGGTAIGGGPPCENDGTWGWDFERRPHRRIWLNWSHSRYQGGAGNYKTDGPKLHLHE